MNLDPLDSYKDIPMSREQCYSMICIGRLFWRLYDLRCITPYSVSYADERSNMMCRVWYRKLK